MTARGALAAIRALGKRACRSDRVWVMMRSCAKCRSEKLRATDETLSRSVGGHRFSANVPALKCAACGELYLDAQVGRRFDRGIARELVAAGLDGGPAFQFVRRALGISNVEFAKMVGVTPATLSRWENGRRPADRAAVLVLALLLTDGEAAMRVVKTMDEPKTLARNVRLELAR